LEEEEKKKKKKKKKKKEKVKKDDEKKRKRVSEQRKKITDPEVLKVQNALEHVIVIGAKVRRDNWRHQEFIRRSQQDLIIGCPSVDITKQKDYDIGGNSTRRRQRKRQQKLVHAEDIRIYGNSREGPFKRGIPMNPWPSEDVGKMETNVHHHQQQQRKRSDDSEWNVEHGDSIPPVLFRMARLSQEYPSEERLRIFNDASLSRTKTLQSTNITLDEASVPRALIERCWERAVHAASNSMFAPITAKVTSQTSESNNHLTSKMKQSTTRSCYQYPSSQFDLNTPLSQESCRIKCKSLGIDIESERAKTMAISKGEATLTKTCPRCTRSFETSNELESHYYGNGATGGCWRPLVRPRHLDLIDKLLQSHVQSQTDLLLNVIMTQATTDQTDNDVDVNNKNNASTRISEESIVANKKRKRLLSWKDVSSCLKDALDDTSVLPIESTTNRVNTRHAVQQSIQTTDNNESTPPLILNQMVLDAANRRLIDRYANVPR